MLMQKRERPQERAPKGHPCPKRLELTTTFLRKIEKAQGRGDCVCVCVCVVHIVQEDFPPLVFKKIARNNHTFHKTIMYCFKDLNQNNGKMQLTARCAGGAQEEPPVQSGKRIFRNLNVLLDGYFKVF